jgi:hypothetical protein
MGFALRTERHAQQIAGVLSCDDRMIVQGTLPVFCYAEGMTAYLSKRRVRTFDCTQFAKPLTDAIKANAEELTAASGLTIGYTQLDNAFTSREDWAAAQALADSWDPSSLHRKLDEFAQRYCPILQQIEESYPWSLDEAEYATGIVLRRQTDLQAIYGNPIRTAIHTVKPDDIATFLGKKLNGNYQDEMGNRYNVRIEGTRVRHSMGMASNRMYDKFGQMLRIETTAKDVSFFQHYRAVEQRNGESVMQFAPIKKTIYSLGALREVPGAANRR